jgi:hypothetical protein
MAVSILYDASQVAVLHRLNICPDSLQTPNPSGYTTPAKTNLECFFLDIGRWEDSCSSPRNKSYSDYWLRRVDIPGWFEDRRCASSIPLQLRAQRWVIRARDLECFVEALYESEAHASFRHVVALRGKSVVGRAEGWVSEAGSSLSMNWKPSYEAFHNLPERAPIGRDHSGRNLQSSMGATLLHANAKLAYGLEAEKQLRFYTARDRTSAYLIKFGGHFRHVRHRRMPLVTLFEVGAVSASTQGLASD